MLFLAQALFSDDGRSITGYDLYCPRSAAAQLGISESFFRASVKNDSAAPQPNEDQAGCAGTSPFLPENWGGVD
jgi:hypothetical protein